MTTNKIKGSIDRHSFILETQRNSICYKIMALPSMQEKRELVGKTNPFLFIFGKLDPRLLYIHEYKGDE